MNIEKINEYGLDLYDKILIPCIKSGAVTVEGISQISNIYTIFTQTKIDRFVKYLNEKSKEKIFKNIQSIKDKAYLLQSLKKAVETDDDLQLFILTQIVNEFLKNDKLNYYEKSLYYNINQFSNDDYLVLDNFYKNRDKNKDFYTITELSDIENIVVNKFINVGILIKYDQLIVGTSQTFKTTEYTKIIINYIEKYRTLNN